MPDTLSKPGSDTFFFSGLLSTWFAAILDDEWGSVREFLRVKALNRRPEVWGRPLGFLGEGE